MVDTERSVRGMLNSVFQVLANPDFGKWLGPALLLIDSILCALILRTVAYTEIDWTSYMQQIALYSKGIRDYTRIEGSTGPLVYPAGHVFVYKALYDITNRGTDILTAQMIFGGLYIVTLALVMACYYNAKAPPYIFPMLILSKRLHSIFLLRCFNDGIVALALFLCIFLLQRRQWTVACVVFSLGLSVKMSILLVGPALAAIIYQALGGSQAFRQGLTIVNIQVLIAIPFLRANWRGYVGRAFELTRTFLYKWTVNWKFIDEATFLSRPFAIGLLVVHVAILGGFLYTRWMRPLQQVTGSRVHADLFDVAPSARDAILNALTPQFILTIMLTANAIGMLCARSLHFQFFAWLGWATPFLLWRAKLSPLVQYMLWSGQELAWNVYPSSDLSSKIVVGVLALTVLEIWLGTDDEKKDQVPVPVMIDEGVTNRTRESDDAKLYRALADEKYD